MICPAGTVYVLRDSGEVIFNPLDLPDTLTNIEISFQKLIL